MGKISLPPITVHARFTAQELGEQVPWSLRDFGVPAIWKRSRGKGVLIGIVDTGIDEVHAGDGDLADAIEDTRDFSHSRSGPRDVFGHGTHVAGTAAAREGNRKGVAGVAPDSKLLIAKALGDDGGGTGESVGLAIIWCCDKGAKVINCSLGSAMPDPPIKSAIDYANGKGVFVVCAAGNTGRINDLNFPARWDGTIAVGALDRNARLARFSSRGPQLDVAWPGEEITSTYLNGGYAVLSGTSMAAPAVAGLVALRLSSELAAGGIATTSTQTMLAVLKDSAKDLGTPGFDNETGWGLVDPNKFVPEASAAPIPAEGITVFIPGGRLVA